MSDVVHLARWQCYDEDTMWCTDMPVGLQTRRIEEATCIDCLSGAAGYGDECRARAAELQAGQVGEVTRRKGFTRE